MRDPIQLSIARESVNMTIRRWSTLEDVLLAITRNLINGIKFHFNQLRKQYQIHFCYLNNKETHLFSAIVLSLRKPSKRGPRIDTFSLFVDTWLQIGFLCVNIYYKVVLILESVSRIRHATRQGMEDSNITVTVMAVNSCGYKSDLQTGSFSFPIFFF